MEYGDFGSREETINGKTLTRNEWCREYGISPVAVMKRMGHYKMEFELAVRLPKVPNKDGFRRDPFLYWMNEGVIEVRMKETIQEETIMEPKTFVRNLQVMMATCDAYIALANIANKYDVDFDSLLKEVNELHNSELFKEEN